MNLPITARPRQGFALVLVLVILSLMAIIAVGYLSSMASERATANAFSNKARAEQAAQAGVDSAVGILRDYFTAFPDSVTAWDTAQSTNSADAVTKQGFPATNEGTTLYLRALPLANSSDVGNVPDPAPNATDASSTFADYDKGNGPNDVDTSTGADKRAIFALPLVSGAKVKALANKATALPTPVADNTAAADSVDLNTRRQISDKEGWLGSPPNFKHAPIPTDANPTLPKPVPVPWVEIKQSENYPDPTVAPVVARYAYWVEDESFRANVNYAGLGLYDQSTKQYTHLRRDNTALPTPALNPTDVDLIGSLDTLATPPPLPAIDPSTPLAKGIFDTRMLYPGQLFADARGFAHYGDLVGKETSEHHSYLDALSYLTTTQSSALNLTRHGTQRLNLNALIPPDAVIPPPTQTVQDQITKLVKTILFHVPNFGQRFYRIAPGQTGAAIASGSITAPAVLNQMAVTHDPASSTDQSTNYAKIYPYKIAANIRDYMDTDCLPTVVMAGGTIATPSRPTLPFGELGDNPVWAIGKDATPFMQECATRCTGTSTPGGRYTLYVDYYVELWNMSTKDVAPADLGPHPFIRIAAPPKWVVNNSVKYTPTGGSPVAAYSTQTDDIPPCDDPVSTVSPSDTRGSKTGRDYDIDLSNVRFPAGKVTLVTTDPNFKEVITDLEAQNNTVVCPFLAKGKRLYTGPMLASGVTRPAAGKDVLWMILENGTTTDYKTYITIGNDRGYIDCLQGALNISYTGNVTDPPGTTAAYPLLFGAVSRGNWTNDSGRATNGMQSAALGDPRTNNEQLTYNLTTGSAIDRSRYNNYEVAAVGNSPTMTVGNPDTGVYQTLGLPNYRSVRPNRLENPWPDFPVLYRDPTAPYTDYPKHLDPNDELVLTAAKAPMPIANKPLSSIGQLGDIFDPSRMLDGGELKHSRGGGRSLKIGQHDDRWDGDQTSASRTWAAWRLTDVFSTDNSMQQPGLININGVARDNGAALRAALTGFKFQPDPASAPLGDPLLSDTSKANLNIDNLVAEIKARLNPKSTTPATGIWQTGTGPFWERGELSELPGFGRTPDQIKPDRSDSPTTYPDTKNAYSTTSHDPTPPEQTDTKITGGAMSSKVFARGREELFRRLVEMITTRGNVFTVYALGQSINQTNPSDPKTKRVAGTHQLKVTFRLVPKQKLSTGYTDFHPGSDNNGQAVDFTASADLHTRFAKPDDYEVQVLATSSGNL